MPRPFLCQAFQPICKHFPLNERQLHLWGISLGLSIGWINQWTPCDETNLQWIPILSTNQQYPKKTARFPCSCILVQISDVPGAERAAASWILLWWHPGTLIFNYLRPLLHIIAAVPKGQDVLRLHKTWIDSVISGLILKAIRQICHCCLSLRITIDTY